VSDGEETWTYFKALDQYRREAAVPMEGVGKGGEKSSPSPAANESFLDLYTSLGDEGVASSVVGEQDIQWGGRSILCTVIESTPTATDPSGLSKGPDTLWVDPARALVLKSVHRTEGQWTGTKTTTRMELTFDEILVEEAPPDELFAFEPPAGAKEVEDFTMGSATRTDLSGKAAPDFRLDDLDGRPHRLANYRGKVVVLDFWASWCAPCRKELPAIERLHREYGSKGLVVLAVNTESHKVASSFMKKYGYSFTVLTDVEGAVFHDYAIASIPVTVVVDKEGVVTAHFVGYQGEEELLAAIRRAGLP
jgi:peroxiredoxin/outer membrane lipoprotein-sorting protein